MLANVPGWQTAYLHPMGGGEFRPGAFENYEHGWPLTYLRRDVRESVTITFSPWDLPHGILEFRAFALAGNVLADVAIFVLAGSLLEARRRRRQSCFQFHLSELLAFVTLVVIAMSFYAVRRKEYREECRIYAWLHRDDGKADWTPNGPDWMLDGPEWLLPVLGKERYYELFARLYSVEAGNDDLKEVAKLRRLLLLRLDTTSPEDMAILTQFPKLEAIQLMPVGLFDQTVELPQLPHLRALNCEILTNSSDMPNWRITGLSSLKALESLSIADDQFDDAAMADLDGMAHLHYLDLGNSKVTAAGLRHLQKATELYWLCAWRTQIDDAALPIIGNMKRLCLLELPETQVTDAGLESLKSLKELDRLDLYGTRVTAEGVRKLQQSLPNCEIDWSP